MKNDILAVIPARYNSSRFPGKPLAEISGRSILEHLYREFSWSKLVTRVVVATDSDIIKTAVEKFGGEVIMTSKKHRTGSDRSAEVAMRSGAKIIINVQADHLGLKAADYDRVIREMIADRTINHATFIRKIETESDLFDANRVKVIFDKDNNAIWFSRYPLPYLQSINGDRLATFDFYYHIGVYFYRRAALEKYAALPRSAHEKAESLEQLRILDNGGKIRLFKIKRDMISIDTPEDLKNATRILNRSGG
jgi:3-deoxy-manno-octulosonate cytidylyltransferase (CMP-KDO synthetase)